MKKKNHHVRAAVFAALAVLAIAAAAVLPAESALTADSRSGTSDSVTLIIDAGHGGADGGAVSVTGTYESAINLQIAQRLRLVCALYGVDAAMTRTTEELSYPSSAKTIRQKKVWDQKTRLEIVNSTENAVFISIHQNIFSSASSRGIQILYAPTEGSQELASAMEASFSAGLPETRLRAASKIDTGIFLLNNITCPGVLIECGFLSNPEEAVQLEQADYQIKIAAAIAAGYFTSAGTAPTAWRTT